MKGFSSKQKKLIPDKPDNVYIRDNKIVSIAKQLADGVATSAIFFGGTGTGKSTMARYICQDIGCPVIATVNCTESLDQYILGKWMPSEKGFFFKESAVTDAIRNGGAVIFEEINFGEPRFMSFFHSLMDNRKFVQLDNGEIVNVHPNFRIFATMNPGYEGTEMLNLALYDRFNIKLLVDELPLESIRPFVKINYNLDDEDFNFMAKIYLMVKNKIDAEQLDIAIAPDIIKHWAREYSYGCSLSEAAKITIAAIGFDDKEFNKYVDSLISYSIAKRK